MDIYQILKTKPHNSHHLNRYFKFVTICNEKNSNTTNTYIEKHHILPKAKDMFPEYSSLTKYPANCAKLTFRQHLLAHYMLMKAYNTQSQILSFIRTSGQHHAKTLKGVNTKLLEKAAIKLSILRKGVFTRGYMSNGMPNISLQTKEKLSKNKKDFYSNLQNRQAQSRACMGKKKLSTEKMKIAAANRSENHSKNLLESLRKTWDRKKQANDTKRVKDGVYVTPIGVFTSIPDYRQYCRNPDKIFTVHSVKKNPKLNKSVIGMTPRQLGFFFVNKSDVTISQYYGALNLARLPEPNHPLALELSDFLLRERLLPQN